ncbi:MAG: thymidine kinase [Acidobacteriota bacterium]|jgi:thymidine kinase|nr:thymidine kinase [Acidobacteriota bacterium]
MAQLYFRYSTMNAGKSTEILKIAHNYAEQNKRVLLFTPALDDRFGRGVITSRMGFQRDALILDDRVDVVDLVRRQQPDCVLVDEGQFLTRPQVIALCRVVDELGVPVIVYGLKNDFRNRLFPGSESLLLFADKIEEVKTVCWYCTKKATMLIRMRDGKPVSRGAQIEIGGNDRYVSVCRRCYAQRLPLE